MPAEARRGLGEYAVFALGAYKTIGLVRVLASSCDRIQEFDLILVSLGLGAYAERACHGVGKDIAPRKGPAVGPALR